MSCYSSAVKKSLRCFGRPALKTIQIDSEESFERRYQQLLACFNTFDREWPIVAETSASLSRESGESNTVAPEDDRFRALTCTHCNSEGTLAPRIETGSNAESDTVSHVCPHGERQRLVCERVPEEISYHLVGDVIRSIPEGEAAWPRRFPEDVSPRGAKRMLTRFLFFPPVVSQELRPTTLLANPPSTTGSVRLISLIDQDKVYLAERAAAHGVAARPGLIVTPEQELTLEIVKRPIDPATGTAPATDLPTFGPYAILRGYDRGRQIYPPEPPDEAPLEEEAT